MKLPVYTVMSNYSMKNISLISNIIRIESYLNLIMLLSKYVLLYKYKTWYFRALMNYDFVQMRIFHVKRLPQIPCFSRKFTVFKAIVSWNKFVFW
jgi:hypothetical protein